MTHSHARAAQPRVCGREGAITQPWCTKTAPFSAPISPNTRPNMYMCSSPSWVCEQGPALYLSFSPLNCFIHAQPNAYCPPSTSGASKNIFLGSPMWAPHHGCPQLYPNLMSTHFYCKSTSRHIPKRAHNHGCLQPYPTLLLFLHLLILLTFLTWYPWSSEPWRTRCGPECPTGERLPVTTPFPPLRCMDITKAK